MTVREAAEQLGLSVTSLRQLVASKRIGHLRLGPSGGLIRFTPEHLSAYRDSCEVPARTSPPSAPRPKREPLIPYRILYQSGPGPGRARQPEHRLDRCCEKATLSGREKSCGGA